MEIFCDESGFTGNQLLDSQQQIFAYATVAISSAEAEELVKRVRQKHRLQGSELKGADLGRVHTILSASTIRAK